MIESARAAGVGRGMAIALLSVLMFSGVDVFNKLLGQTMPVAQIVWLRFLGYVPIAILMAYRPGAGVAWRSARPGLQALRAVILVVEMGLFVGSLQYIQIADMQAIGAAAPLIVVALSVPLLGEPVGWRRWLAVALGFVGVLVVLRPGFQDLNAGGAMALAGTVLWALYQILLRIVGRVDGAATTALWTATVGAASATLAAPFVWQPPTAWEWVLVTGAVVIGAAGHTLYSRAFVLAPAAAIQPLNYGLLVFAVPFGWLFFGDLPDAWMLTGAALIVGSGLYAFHRERVRAAQRSDGLPKGRSGS